MRYFQNRLWFLGGWGRDIYLLNYEIIPNSRGVILSLPKENELRVIHVSPSAFPFFLSKQLINTGSLPTFSLWLYWSPPTYREESDCHSCYKSMMSDLFFWQPKSSKSSIYLYIDIFRCLCPCKYLYLSSQLYRISRRKFAPITLICYCPLHFADEIPSLCLSTVYFPI